MEGGGILQYRISFVTAFFMLAFTVTADLLQALLDLTVVLSLGADLVTFIAEAGLALWFLILGISYTEGKRKKGKFLSVILTTVIELIPIVDALPMLTITTVYLIYASRAEDREKLKEDQAQAAQQELAQAVASDAAARSYNQYVRQIQSARKEEELGDA